MPEIAPTHHSPLAGQRRLRRDELARVSLLRNVSLEMVQGILEHCPVRSLNPGEALITPGAVERCAYLLLEGELRVHLDTPENEPVAVLETGDTVGELSLIDRKPRSAYVVAAKPTRALEVDETVFWSIVNSSHEVALNLLGVLSRRLRGNNSSLSESRRLQQQYRRHALVDGLTGLYNRRWLDDVLPRQVSRARFDGKPLSLVMIDIDHFKRFNDNHGHQAGDFVLFAVAQVLRQRFRPTDLVTRYGGEEFTVILPETTLSGARAAADRVRQAVADTQMILPDDTPLPSVTVSAGIAERGAEDDASNLLSHADHALYVAKDGGRNRVESWGLRPIESEMPEHSSLP